MDNRNYNNNNTNKSDYTNRNNSGVAPIKEGEVYDVQIQSIGGKGDGIAKIKGFVIFVPKVEKGDFVKIRVTKVLANSGFAELVNKLEKPPMKSPKFATVTMAEMNSLPSSEPKKHYEETEDFGEN